MRPIAHIIATLSSSEETSDSTLGNLLSQVKDQGKIQSAILAILPPLMNQCKLKIRLTGNTLTLITENSAQAAKLRQLLPSIHQHIMLVDPAIEKVRVSFSKAP